MFGILEAGLVVGEVVATEDLTVFDFRFCLSQKNESKMHA